MLNPGIVDENVNAAEFTSGSLNHTLYLCRLCDVSGTERRSDPEFLCDLLSLGFNSRRVAKAVQHDIATGLRESARDAKADAAC
jgi:predicted metal-binding protein